MCALVPFYDRKRHKRQQQVMHDCTHIQLIQKRLSFANLKGGSRWGLMLSVNGPCSIVFNVEMLKILLFTVIEDLAVKCC